MADGRPALDIGFAVVVTVRRYRVVVAAARCLAAWAYHQFVPVARALLMRRVMRRLASVPIAMLLGVVSATSMIAATPIGHSGHIGRYTIEDSVADPGAVCRYDSGAGSHYLRRVRVGPIAMWGLRTTLQQVGYRLLLQQRIGGSWTTVVVGPLQTAHGRDGRRQRRGAPHGSTAIRRCSRMAARYAGGAPAAVASRRQP